MSITDELRRHAQVHDLIERNVLLVLANRIDKALEEGYIELPKDADGVPIRVGDVMENVIHPPTHREVTGVGVECFYAWEDGCGRYSQFGANCYRHHREPTVEDVLEEFFGKANLPDGTQTRAEIIAEYAAKLRLAGEGA